MSDGAMHAGPRVWTLEIGPDLRAVRQVRHLAERMAHELGLDRTAAYELKVALHEATTNGVVHGCRSPSDCVRVRAVADADELAVDVVDPGGRLERTAPPADPLAPSGRGNVLIRATTDALAVDVQPGRTTVRFVKHLRGPIGGGAPTGGAR